MAANFFSSPPQNNSSHYFKLTEDFFVPRIPQAGGLIVPKHNGLKLSLVDSVPTEFLETSEQTEMSPQEEVSVTHYIPCKDPAEGQAIIEGFKKFYQIYNTNYWLVLGGTGDKPKQGIFDFLRKILKRGEAHLPSERSQNKEDYLVTKSLFLGYQDYRRFELIYQEIWGTIELVSHLKSKDMTEDMVSVHTNVLELFMKLDEVEDLFWIPEKTIEEHIVKLEESLKKLGQQGFQVLEQNVKQSLERLAGKKLGESDTILVKKMQENLKRGFRLAELPGQLRSLLAERKRLMTELEKDSADENTAETSMPRSQFGH